MTTSDEILAAIRTLQEADSEPAQSPEEVITIRTSGGGSHAVPTTESIPIRTAITRAGLALGGATELWVNGNQVDLDFVVAPGSVVTAVGTVKGG